MRLLKLRTGTTGGTKRISREEPEKAKLTYFECLMLQGKALKIATKPLSHQEFFRRKKDMQMLRIF